MYKKKQLIIWHEAHIKNIQQLQKKNSRKFGEKLSMLLEEKLTEKQQRSISLK